MNDVLTRRRLLAGGVAGLFLAGCPNNLGAQTPGSAALNDLCQAFLSRFDVPGMAVAVIRPGQPDFVRGFGIRTLGRPERVDAHTLFGIGSNSKAFTAAALALLVDEGEIGWDEPVVRYLPDFQMYDPAATNMMTVRDLLVHRSGLSLGEGDLMQFPTTTHTLEDIVHGLRYLKPERGFREGFAYDNILYIVAGVVLAKVSGQSWEEFVTAKLFRPLGMDESVAGFTNIATTNIAGRHARLGPPVRGLGPMRVVQPDEQNKIDAAGGINTSAADAVRWLKVQLAHGKLPNGSRLWSERQSAEMWTPQTIVASTAGPTPDMPQRPVLSGYALGWIVQDYRGHRLLSHSGALTGQITQHALLPDLGCAVAVYTNEETGVASAGLRNALLDHLIGAPPFDWLAVTTKRLADKEAQARKSPVAAASPPSGGPSLPLERYAGRYRDPWYGDIVVSYRDGRLSIDFTRTPAFKSTLEPWGKNVFRTRFAEGVGEDAVVTFAVADGRVTGVTMKALSPLADFSYDFQDLAFQPVR